MNIKTMKRDYRKPECFENEVNIENNVMSNYGQGSLPGSTGWDDEE